MKTGRAAFVTVGLFLLFTVGYIIGGVWLLGWAVTYLIFLLTGIDGRGDFLVVLTLGFAIGGWGPVKYGKERMRLSLMRHRMRVVEESEEGGSS